MIKTAIILGATGLTGGLILQKLCADNRYQKVIVFTRKPIKNDHPKVEEIVCNLFELDRVKDRFKADEVYCCVGTTLKKTPDQLIYKKVDFGIPVEAAKLCAANKIDTFLVVSALGANINSPFFYNRIKGEMEGFVTHQAIPNTYVLRPSLIVGNRKEGRIGEKVGIVFMTLIQPFLIGGLRKYRKIKASTLAQAMINLANNDHPDKIIESDQIQKLGHL